MTETEPLTYKEHKEIIEILQKKKASVRQRIEILEVIEEQTN